MKRGLGVAAAVAAFCLWGSGAFAQSGAISKAVGGYTWENASKLFRHPVPEVLRAPAHTSLNT